MKELSIIIPAYNEEKNIKPLYEELKKFLDGKFSYEIIFIDDGSADKTFDVAQEIHKNDRNVKIIKFRKNFGQSSAMDAGFHEAVGDIIIPMDADMQNDPKDIPKLVAKIREGYDVVAGWRKNRKDPIIKKIFSRIANILRHIIIKDVVHDSGCTLKAYKKQCFEDFRLLGEMHRFIPALLSIKGFKITEIVVNHRVRKHGKTKYNSKRIVKGFLDLIIVKFWSRYSSRPIHFFGGFGILGFLFGMLMGIYLLIERFVYGKPLAERPLLLLAVLLIIIGIQFILFGIMADISSRNYYKNSPNYSIEKIVK